MPQGYNQDNQGSYSRQEILQERQNIYQQLIEQVSGIPSLLNEDMFSCTEQELSSYILKGQQLYNYIQGFPSDIRQHQDFIIQRQRIEEELTTLRQIYEQRFN